MLIRIWYNYAYALDGYPQEVVCTRILVRLPPRQVVALILLLLVDNAS